MPSSVAPLVASDDLLDTSQAAQVLCVSTGTLHTWRCTRAVKIPFIRIGRKVRYRRSALLQYLDEHTCEN